MTSTQNAPDDQDVRDALSAIRGATPEARDLSALRRRLATAPPPRRAPRRTLGLIATATAVVGVGIALMPAAERPDPRSPAALDALRTPSALASEVPPVRDGRFRYAKVRTRYTHVATRGDRTATQRSEETSESWVSGGWKGRQLTVYDASSVSGDPDLGVHGFARPPREGSRSDGRYLSPDGPLATLDPADLPAGRDAIGRALRDGVRTNRWAEGRRRGVPFHFQGSTDSFVAYSIIDLLVDARLTADQRAAFLDVLRTDRNARSGGVGTDSEGRRGQVIDLDFTGKQALLGVKGLRVVFDPQSAEILEWSAIPTPARDDQPNTAQTTTVLRSAYVASTRARP